MHRTWLLAAPLWAALLIGCGSGVYPVDGKVQWQDGTPATELSGSNITFEGDQTSSQGSIQADASFQLTTNEPDDGAPAGNYKVLIVEVGRQPLPGGDGTLLAPSVVDSKYADPQTSDLEATVKPGRNEITLKVDRNSGR